MARADLIADLVTYGMSGDRVRFRKTVEALIVEERAKNHGVLADRLGDLLTVAPQETATAATPNGQINGSHSLEARVGNLYIEKVPERTLDELLLPSDVESIIKEVISEHHRVDLLRSYSLEPRNRLLFVGPPGNGKTSLAEAIAESLMVPLLRVRYDGIVGAYLGETAVRLKRLLDAARTRKCVLFFDEVETIAKERGDTRDTGEIKRVVSSLLLQIDDLPSHVIVIGATNHPELLDRAVWRRFQVRAELPMPTRAQLAEWFAKFEKRLKQPLGQAPDTLAKKLYGINFAEAEEFAISVMRRHILSQPDGDIKKIVQDTLKTWKARSVNAGSEDGGNA
ncbi:ATP-binding protein [Stieleria sp. JC731]|uniref:AAA family ATPase n=1 Tax=Pirellulaceae TaxID=2691357 RepID=UPI001E2A93F5|nr:ATP-binding protein [Stieleria sp. JC731]MCC9601013.1 ATP-binding protein [Stieleria sp. JC731]